MHLCEQLRDKTNPSSRGVYTFYNKNVNRLSKHVSVLVTRKSLQDKSLLGSQGCKIKVASAKAIKAHSPKLRNVDLRYYLEE